MADSITLSLGAATAASRTCWWNGSAFIPTSVAADTSVARVFRGWANPSKEGITPAVGDTWLRRGSSAPVNLILDTDLDTDVDDIFDVKAALVYHQEGIANLLGIACTTTNMKGPGSIRASGNYYGYAVPVASIKPLVNDFHPPNTGAPTTSAYFDLLYASPYDHTGIGLADTVTDSTTAYRTWLANSSGNVHIVMTGYGKAFRLFLDSAADGISGLTGFELAAAKIACVWVVTGAEYPTSGGDWNVIQNPADWSYIAANCTCPIAWIPTSLGQNVGIVGGTYLNSRRPSTDPGRVCMAVWAVPHPTPDGRPPWGVNGIQLAVEGYQKFGCTTVAGTNVINASTGANVFTPGAGLHTYLVAPSPSQNTAMLAHHQSLVAADAVSGSYTWNGSAWV